MSCPYRDEYHFKVHSIKNPSEVCFDSNLTRYYTQQINNSEIGACKYTLMYTSRININQNHTSRICHFKERY